MLEVWCGCLGRALNSSWRLLVDTRLNPIFLTHETHLMCFRCLKIGTGASWIHSSQRSPRISSSLKILMVSVKCFGVLIKYIPDILWMVCFDCSENMADSLWNGCISFAKCCIGGGLMVMEPGVLHFLTLKTLSYEGANGMTPLVTESVTQVTLTFSMVREQ